MPWIDSQLGKGGKQRDAINAVLDLAAENDDLRRKLDSALKKSEAAPSASKTRMAAAARMALFERVVITKPLPSDADDIMRWTRLHVAILPDQISYQEFVDEFQRELTDEFLRQRAERGCSGEGAE